MKRIFILISFFALLATISRGQSIVRDVQYRVTTVIDSVTYYQECRLIEYSDGRKEDICQPRVDSVQYIANLFRDAKQAKDIEQDAITRIINSTTQAAQFLRNSNLLDSLTNENYFQHADRRYLSAFINTLWRFRETATDSVFFMHVNQNGIGRQANITLNPREKTFTVDSYVTGGESSKFFLFDTDYFRYNNLWDYGRVDFVQVSSIADDNGLDTGRTLWMDKDRRFSVTKLADFRYSQE